MRTMKTSFLTLAILATAVAPVSATEFQLYGSYWDTTDVDATGGGGVGFSFPVAPVFAIDVRATYYQEIENAAFDAIFDEDEEVFQEFGLEVLPIEAGVRFNFLPDGEFVRPWVGGGGSYMMIDTTNDRFDVDDEIGFYGTLGADFGDNDGFGFFAEALYRSTEATITEDPNDDDDLDIDDDVSIDLDGISFNAGLYWSF